jgi:hypothetical protein
MTPTPDPVWTKARIQREGPLVSVQLGQTRYEGVIDDGEAPCAMVTIRGTNLRGLVFPWSMRLEYSWDAVAHALNHGTALLM